MYYLKPVSGFLLASLVSFFASISALWLGETILGFERSPISEIMMAIILGMLVANTIDLPDYFGSGLKFCTSFVLRFGIMLLGIRLSLFSAGKFTLVAIPFVLIAITLGLLVVRFLGKKMNLSLQLTGLIAIGTSICGATAIVAAAPIIKAKETEVGYAIACITIFGIVAMFSYPILGNFLFSDRPELAGLFLGVSIHETAQVAGAGMMYQTQYNAPIALDYATVTKLVRNLCMIAVIPIIGVIFTDRNQNMNNSEHSWIRMIPWFIFGFTAMSAIRSPDCAGHGSWSLSFASNTVDPTAARYWTSRVTASSSVRSDPSLFETCAHSASALTRATDASIVAESTTPTFTADSSKWPR